MTHTRLTLDVQRDWPEPLVFTQSISEAGHSTIPDRYIKPPAQRPCFNSSATSPPPTNDIKIPIIDLDCLHGEDATRSTTLKQMFEACTEWGFFQVLNHGVSPQLMDRAREVWYGFFHQPTEVKQVHANTPETYEGYGARFGVDKDLIFDWGDYFLLYHSHPSLRNPQNWPAVPLDLRSCLGLGEDFLHDAFGGVNMGTVLRTNFYPKCPQPELTLGLASHSDPDALTILLPEKNVPGLQVLKGGQWINVIHEPHAFIINIGDQIQVLTNAIYTSAEHRSIVASDRERVSLALFFNPKLDLPIGPAKEFVNPGRPALYPATTFDEYKMYVRNKGLKGKSQLKESQKVNQDSHSS